MQAKNTTTGKVQRKVLRDGREGARQVNVVAVDESEDVARGAFEDLDVGLLDLHVEALEGWVAAGFQPA